MAKPTKMPKKMRETLQRMRERRKYLEQEEVRTEERRAEALAVRAALAERSSMQISTDRPRIANTRLALGMAAASVLLAAGRQR